MIGKTAGAQARRVYHQSQAGLWAGATEHCRFWPWITYLLVPSRTGGSEWLLLNNTGRGPHNGGPATNRLQSWKERARDEGTVHTREKIPSGNMVVLYLSTGPARGHPKACTRDPHAAQTANITAQSSFSTWLSDPLSLSELWELVLLHHSQHFTRHYIKSSSKRKMFMYISLLLERTVTPRENFLCVTPYLRALVCDQQETNHSGPAAKFLHTTKISFHIQ